MEQGSFKSYLFENKDVDDLYLELFLNIFRNKIELLPDNVCSYRVIYNICIDDTTTQYARSVLNVVWNEYFKLKINGRLGIRTINSKKEKIELEIEYPIR